ncbi:MAG: NADH:ubiquinone oxidoreductase chain I-like protein [Anaerolinea sp.]|nr:NADH:ubiquinone oxidoreductase chain I-like protein [Anaerolinea sp.]
MNGFGIVKGLFVTIKHFFTTYWVDLFHGKKNKTRAARRGMVDSAGLFTVQYPEEIIIPSEEFRVIPFLIYEVGENGVRKYRCTSCGICAKVCPTQCIYITRKKDEVTGKPILSPEEFYIDTDKCMNCGSCAEFCPFDAIKMDHDFEIATYERGETHIYSKEKLGKPLEYYAKIRPVNYASEEAARQEKASVH